jgi:membrane associated rhomboid family serine protease
VIPLRDTQPRRGVPLATLALIAANVLAFAALLGLDERELERAVLAWGVVPLRYVDPEAWYPDARLAEGLAGAGILARYAPFVASMFLHGGIAHLVGNLWTLWIFGDNVEDRMGALRYLAFYLVCGLFATVLHVATNASSPLPVIGASGAIAGVMGAYFALFPRARIMTLIPIFCWPLFVEIPAIVFLLLWFLTQLVSGLATVGVDLGGGIAWWAHVGGFAMGLIAVPWFIDPRRNRR